MTTLAQRFGVNIRDYTRDAADRGWGTGWRECGGARGNIVAVVAPISGTRFPVHRRIARIMSWRVDRAERVHRYRFDPTQCGANNCRNISGTNVSSNHAWGLADDDNWRRNPYTTQRITDIPQGMVDDANYVGFAWGGHYTGPKKDWMHFEYMGTPRQADLITEALFAEGEFDAMANEQLANINRQLTGSDNPREYPGWETKRYNVAAQEFLTLVDIARQADRELRSNYDLSGRPSEGYDTAVGHILNIAARQVEILKRLDRIDAALAALKRP